MKATADRMRGGNLVLVGLFLVLALGGWAQEGAAGGAGLEISQFRVGGEIDGENITFELRFRAEVGEAPRELALTTGNLVLLDEQAALPEGTKIRYDAASATYYLLWSRRGSYEMQVRFAVWPRQVEGGEWREATFETPTSRVRELELLCDRPDLEVLFPGALKQTRTMDDGGRLRIAALLGPGKPFQVRWKPQVVDLDGKLVLASDANTVVTVGVGALRLDNLYVFKVAQGKLRELSFAVPEGLNVTQVRGPFIRDWRLAAEEDGRLVLRVILNRPVVDLQPVQIIAEQGLGAFPVALAVPVIQPLEVIRASGQVGVGTNSAIQLLVAGTAGLSQVDAGAFPRLVLSQEQARPLPTAKSFYYTYATTPYNLQVSLADIVPAYDVSGRLVYTVKEDNLTLAGDFEIDVREAGIRSLTLWLDGRLVVSTVAGAEVVDFSLRERGGAGGRQAVDVEFRQPVLGRSLLKLQAEMGGPPIGVAQELLGLGVEGAQSERGYVVLVAEKGVQLGLPEARELRQVHTASIPMAVANAQFAYRYRASDWQLALTPTKKPSSVLVESFHLLSVADGITYGSALFNYFISGAPLDEFRFALPEEYRNVEFVGRDVRRWDREGELWVVKLQRKVMGDFNLGLTFNLRPGAERLIVAGGGVCREVESESGYLAVTSGLNLELREMQTELPGLLEIKQDEIPANYRLLAKLPVLRSYKYVGAAAGVELAIQPFAQGTVLPVLIEVMQMNTDLNVNNDGQTQAVTRIRYKLKNSSSQYFSLAMPAAAAYWTVRMAELDEQGVEQLRNVVAQRNEENGLLMVPLPRRRNPNDPITVELEYGQVHGKLGWYGQLHLVAPRTEVRSTFAQWLVRGTERLAVRPGSAGTMLADDRGRGGQAALGEVLRQAWRGWWRAAGGLGELAGVLLLVVAVAVGGLVGIGIWRPRAVWPGMVVGAALLATLVGVVATFDNSRAWQWRGGEDWRQTSFSQALDLDRAVGAEVAVAVTPAWLGGIDPGFMLGWGVAVVAGVLLAGWRRGGLRLLGGALALVGLSSLAAGAPAGRAVLLHLFGWGLPLVVALCFAGLFVKACRVRRPALGRPPARPMAAAVASLLAGLALGLGGTAFGMASTTHYQGYETIVRSIDCQLLAEKDHMQVAIALELETLGPLDIPLVDTGAVMLTARQLAKGVEIVVVDDRFVLRLETAGRHRFKIDFLTPLPPVEESQRRSFRMPLALALTNRVELTIPKTGMEVVAAGAVRFVRQEKAESTVATAVFGPGRELAFAWQPRSRETRFESTSFFAEVGSLFRFDAGLADGLHQVHFQVAQGELADIRLGVPAGMTVTAVAGDGVGAWRFDAATREVEVKLAEPASGDYRLTVTTQMSSDKLPCSFTVGNLQVEGAIHQRGSVGIMTTAAVFATIDSHPPALNLDDYLRDAASLLAKLPGVDSRQVKNAFRVTEPGAVVSLTVNEVRAEIRSTENAGFTVADDRMVYSGEFAIAIAKAGLFSVDLRLSPDFDIDTLSAPEVSHWDELSEAGQRLVRVHFRHKLQGDCRLKFALSKPVAELPPEIVVPRFEAVGALKHGGLVSVSSDRGVRLTVKASERDGVGEQDTAELGIRDERVMSFKLLKPQWRLVLLAELVEPRMNVEFLHVARVSEGMVRHQHYLRYRLFNAGGKFFELQVPPAALGLQIGGPNIARLEEIDGEAGRWRVELAAKVFERPFPLTVTYETTFDHGDGQVELAPVQAMGADLASGFVVVFGSERVELHPAAATLASLQTADPRTVPGKFGQEELAGAAYCFAVTSGDYAARFEARRHQAAELLTAEVLSTRLTTVATESGEMITQVAMQLRSGDRRHLEVTLPKGAEMWSLVVNGGATIPSRRSSQAGEAVMLVPLGQTATTELTVNVDFIFVAPPLPRWQFARQSYEGPRFDLPLKNIVWAIYVPEHWRLSHFGGSLNVDQDSLSKALLQRYDLRAYERDVRTKLEVDLRNAKELQDKGFKLAREGQAYDAKQALEWAYNYSAADPALNEDARVQLNRLMQEQAVAGLVQRRGSFRQQARPSAAPEQAAQGSQALTGAQGWDQGTVVRLQSSLSKADSENLENITDRIIEVQEAAVGGMVQLAINMPLRGRAFNFTRPLQVEPNAAMRLSFDVRAGRGRAAAAGWGWTAGLGVGLVVLFWLATALAGWIRRPPTGGLAELPEGPAAAAPVVSPAVEIADDGEMPAAEQVGQSESPVP